MIDLGVYKLFKLSYDTANNLFVLTRVDNSYTVYYNYDRVQAKFVHLYYVHNRDISSMNWDEYETAAVAGYIRLHKNGILDNVK